MLLVPISLHQPYYVVLSVLNDGRVSQEPMGDVLVFLTGQDDIEAAVKMLAEETQTYGKNSSGTKVSRLTYGQTFVLSNPGLDI